MFGKSRFAIVHVIWRDRRSHVEPLSVARRSFKFIIFKLRYLTCSNKTLNSSKTKIRYSTFDVFDDVIETLRFRGRIWVTVQQIDGEIQRTSNRKSVIIDRLTEMLFFQLLHRYINKNEHLHGFNENLMLS